MGVTVYSPQLRVEQFLARKQDILRSCESLIGFKRGILSEVEAAEPHPQRKSPPARAIIT